MILFGAHIFSLLIFIWVMVIVLEYIVSCIGPLYLIPVFFSRIDWHGVIKVADFGLTEDMYGTKYFRRQKSETGSEENVPIRWMAPESIENDIYNESTDVVSVLKLYLSLYTMYL